MEKKNMLQKNLIPVLQLINYFYYDFDDYPTGKVGSLRIIT